MADMIVSGAGTTEVNGTYVENGTLNGKPKYTYGNYQLSYKIVAMWEGNAWLINRISPNSDYYADLNMANVNTPDLVTAWNKSYLNGTLPVPTVTAAGGGDPPSGTTHEGEATLSSLSYLRTKKS